MKVNFPEVACSFFYHLTNKLLGALFKKRKATPDLFHDTFLEVFPVCPTLAAQFFKT